MLASSRCIEGEIPGYCPPNCSMIVRADPGTCGYITNNELQISQNGGYMILSIRALNLTCETPRCCDDQLFSKKACNLSLGATGADTF